MKFSLVLLLVLSIGRVMWKHADEVGACDASAVKAAMTLAVMDGDAATVERSLRAGAAMTNDAGIPLLGMAASAGQVHVLRVLMDHGADVNAASQSGWTPLMMAALGGHVDAVETLLRAGAKVDMKTDAGVTAISVAIERGHEEIVDRLTSACAAGRGERIAASVP